MIKLFEILGALFMWAFRIENATTGQVETFEPSEGRKYINFDGYNPDALQQNASDNFIAEPVEVAKVAEEELELVAA